MVTDTRAALDRVPFEAVGLYRIEREQSGRNYDLNLLSVLGNPAASVSNRVTIRGAYTRGAYEARVRSRLDDAPSTFIGDPWVLGTELTGNSEGDSRLTERLQSAYYRQYMDEWRGFIQGMRVATPSGRNNTAQVIQELTVGQPPPLGRFWRRVAFETILIDPRANARSGARAGATSLGGRLTTRLRSSTAGRALVAGASAEASANGAATPGFGSIINARDVQTAFQDFIAYGVPPRSSSSTAVQNTNLDLWHEDLDRVEQAIRQGTSYRTPLRTARSRIQDQIRDIDQEWRQSLTNLLLPPLSGIN
jgi:type VI protein secretion system component VasK